MALIPERIKIVILVDEAVRKGAKRQRLVPLLGYPYERFSVGYRTLVKPQEICVNTLGSTSLLISYQRQAADIRSLQYSRVRKFTAECH